MSVTCIRLFFLPSDSASTLPFTQYPRLRVEGEVAGQPFEGTWQLSKGRWYLMLNKGLLKAAEVGVGDEVEVRFSVVDQDAVELPHILQAALANDAQITANWQQLSAGKRRGFAFHVGSAKTAKTRVKRVDEVLTAIKRGLSIRDLKTIKK